MKQFQTIFKKIRGLDAWMNQIRQYCLEHSVKESSVLFRIYADSVGEADRVREVIARIRKFFPQAPYAGVTSTGNIIHGSLSDIRISLTCTVFENPDMVIRILQLPMTYDTQAESADSLIKAAEESSWLQAIEMMTTLSNVDMPAFCHAISELPPHVHFYGGGAHAIEATDGNTTETFVFSSQGDLARYHAVFILLGGSGLHFFMRSLTGWRKLGRPLKVTGSNRNDLISLNDKPAADVYQHYLHIPTDGRFFKVANEFPLLFEEGGNRYMRAVAAIGQDRSLHLAASIDHAEWCNITYGDPVHIMQTIREETKRIHTFAPQVIQLFSCAGRRFFWGPGEVSRETIPFEVVAPTSGFFTSGEFLRSGREVIMHNTTLVIIGMREGEIESPPEDLPEHEEDMFPHQLTISSCLASFIEAQSQELDLT